MSKKPVAKKVKPIKKARPINNKPIENKTLVLSESTKEVIEQLRNPETTRKIIRNYSKLATSPKSEYQTGSELLIKVLEGNTLTEEENNKLDQIVFGTNITENHRMLVEVVTEKRDQFAMSEMVDDLIKEYDCKTVSERSLCEIIVNSYAQVLRISRRMTGTMNAAEYLTHERNAYIGVLSKEIERANRNYLSALQVLREMKSPTSHIHIRTNTAIVGTNQQFNHTSNNIDNTNTNLPPDEIIES